MGGMAILGSFSLCWLFKSRGQRDLPTELAKQMPQAQSCSLSSLSFGAARTAHQPPAPTQRRSRGGRFAATHCALE